MRHRRTYRSLVIGATVVAVLFLAVDTDREDPQISRAAAQTEVLDFHGLYRQTFQKTFAERSSRNDLTGPEPGFYTNTNGAIPSFEALTSNTVAFPHIAMYGGMSSSGWPFVGTIADPSGSADAPLNHDVINAYAKFPLMILPATPLTDGRPDILTALRQANPNSKIFAYTMGHVTWCPQLNGLNSYPEGYYDRDYYLAVTDGNPSCNSTSDRFLWLQNGAKASDPPYDVGLNVNLAKRVQQPDGPYRYVVAEALADVMYNHGYAKQAYDGIFIDVFCSGILWMERGDTDPDPSVDNTVAFDYARAGYGSNNADPANRQAFNQGWKDGFLALANRLRSRITAAGDANFPVAGNCGQAIPELYPAFNGWMRENFPYQNGRTWYTNMYRDPGGYLHEELRFRSPRYGFIFTGADPSSTPYTTYNQRKMRFGLGSVSLGDGYHAFEDTSADPSNGQSYNWWFDEYGVDRQTGRAANSQQYTGWLGQALDYSYQMIWTDSVNDIPNAATNNGFETSGVSPTELSGWGFRVFTPAQATVTRDVSTAAEGDASAHVHIGQVATQNYYVNLYPGTASSSNQFTIVDSQDYSVTFWAKASQQRTIEVIIEPSLPCAAQTIPITTAWKRYQVVMQPACSGSVSFRFNLGAATGDLWLDDVHVQRGASSVYRRDFEHGIVLVNPSGTTATVALERPYRKILGSADPTVNDGSSVSSVTLAGAPLATGIGDAVFLLDVDLDPPGRITDLAAK